MVEDSDSDRPNSAHKFNNKDFAQITYQPRSELRSAYPRLKRRKFNKPKPWKKKPKIPETFQMEIKPVRPWKTKGYKYSGFKNLWTAYGNF